MMAMVPAAMVAPNAKSLKITFDIKNATLLTASLNPLSSAFSGNRSKPKMATEVRSEWMCSVKQHAGGTGRQL